MACLTFYGNSQFFKFNGKNIYFSIFIYQKFAKDPVALTYFLFNFYNLIDVYILNTSRQIAKNCSICRCIDIGTFLIGFQIFSYMQSILHKLQSLIPPYKLLAKGETWLNKKLAFQLGQHFGRRQRVAICFSLTAIFLYLM